MKEKQYKSEKEFLKHYDPSKYERLSATVDILIFSVSDTPTTNYRKLNKKNFSVLLVKRNTHPFKDKWCLPGGFIDVKETIEDAVERVLADEANLHDIYTEQLYTMGEVNRDPRMRVLSVAYMSLIDKNLLSDKLPSNAAWFDITIKERGQYIDIKLKSDKEQISFTVEKRLIQHTTEKYQYDAVENKYLAFDHASIIALGIERLKNKIEYTDIVFNMMPELFTLGELQQVYEVILGKKLLDAAFRRIIKNKVTKTKNMKTGGGHRPSVLFKYKGSRL
ncbi:MAG TPA: NUDIX domain-containing protein [Candidatus Dojkabacteria bacterium]|nr:NUDIX domain-containing protein [Candidatus Dojkabacteria bacterium]